jgi:hypothetical protein
MKRWDIINYLIEKNNFKSYLEIGFGNGDNFNNIKIDNKVGVDPNPDSKCNYNTTSDDYFIKNKEKFDIIFIDGLHIYDQVKKDFLNSLESLNENGCIVLHDCNPTSFEMQRTDVPVNGEWTGDVWKLIVDLKTNRDDLNVGVIDTDYGCGIVKRGKQELIQPLINLEYNSMDENRIVILNLISKENFKEYVENLYNTSSNK